MELGLGLGLALGLGLGSGLGLGLGLPKAPKMTATVCENVRRMLSAYLVRCKG